MSLARRFVRWANTQRKPSIGIMIGVWTWPAFLQRFFLLLLGGLLQGFRPQIRRLEFGLVNTERAFSKGVVSRRLLFILHQGLYLANGSCWVMKTATGMHWELGVG